ncbi:MAG: HD-GYP domain-containing protein [Planctomycetota bacterium]
MRLAKTVVAWDKDTQRSRSLREENDFFVHQLRDDFEGLTYLRSVAKSLADCSESEPELNAIEDNLPGLGCSLGAQEVHFLAADSAGFPMLASSWQMNRNAGRLADSAMLADLVIAFRDLIGTEPLLLNRFESRPEASRFPGVHEAIMMPARSTNGVFGWFVVLNREPKGTPGVEGRNQTDKEFGTSQASLLTTVTAMFASHANNRLMMQERERLLINMVRALVSAVELKDKYTCGHSERVGLFARRVAEEMGVPDQACQKLYLTGLLHDIGKIGVSDAVLKKEGPLTPEEFELIKRHPAEGWGILRELDELRYVLPGVLQHHERVDGKGYPDGLRGDAISLDGRVLAVVDAYDAMTSDRAYRKGMPHERAIAILTEGAGTQWDPIVVAAFMAASSDIAAMRDLYRPRGVMGRELGSGFDELCIPALPRDVRG